MSIDPRTVMVAIPCHDGKTMAELTGALIANANKFCAHTLPTECSHPSLVRNIIADIFLRSPFEWLVGIDSDTYFSSQDLDYLLQPINPEGPADGSPADPTPTRITAKVANQYVQEGEEFDIAVCAEYAYKKDSHEPVKLGGGFFRVHRCVFQTLQELKHDGGNTVEVSRKAMEILLGMRERGVSYTELAVNAVLDSIQDSRGSPRLWQTQHDGRLFTDFYPSGPILSQFIPTAAWKGEDHGFWTLCMLAGIIPRIETRTRLIHIGRKGYPYLGPDVRDGQ